MCSENRVVLFHAAFWRSGKQSRLMSSRAEYSSYVVFGIRSMYGRCKLHIKQASFSLLCTSLPPTLTFLPLSLAFPFPLPLELPPSSSLA